MQPAPPDEAPPAAAPEAPPPKELARPEECSEEKWQMLCKRYAEHAATVHAILMGWQAYHELSELLARPLEDRTLACRQEHACAVAHAAVVFANRFEAVCNGRHKSWYLHLFVYVVPRQVERYGNLWDYSTAALESRGARIKRTKVSWRSYSAEPKECSKERAGRVTKFKHTYRSSPTLQILRMIASAEELYHNGKRRGATRLKETGRFKKMKLEADHSRSTSYENDPFDALASFMVDANVQVGANN